MMNINTKRKRPSSQPPHIMPKLEEEISSQISESDQPQDQSNSENLKRRVLFIIFVNLFENLYENKQQSFQYKVQLKVRHNFRKSQRRNIQDTKNLNLLITISIGYNERIRSSLKSQAILTFVNFPILSKPTERIKLNDQLSYSFIPINYNELQNTSTTLFSIGKIQKGTSSLNSNPVVHELKDGQKSFSDYKNYLLSYPDFRIGSICCYKMKINLNQYTIQDYQRQYTPNKLSDYKNLNLLFSHQHFSIQIINCQDIQNKCIDFIQNYNLKEYCEDQLQYISPPEPLFSSQQQFSNINDETKNKDSQFTKNNNTQQPMVKNELLCDKTLHKMDQTEINENKIIKNYFQYQLLLKNIQYTMIKEITQIKKIQFSEKTISKLINKFILFLKGDYRQLKYYDLDQTNNQEQTVSSKSKQTSSNKNNNQSKSIFAESHSPEIFGIPEFNLFELLNEQDQKEFFTLSPKKNNSRSKKQNSSNDKYFANQSKSLNHQDNRIKSQSVDSHFVTSQFDIQQNLKSFMPQEIKRSNTCQFYQQNYQLSNIQIEKVKEELDDQINSNDQCYQMREFTKVEFDSNQNINKQSSIINEQVPTSNNQKKQKRTLFNLSKYLMHLILEYLSEEHLGNLNLIPGFLPLVQNVIERIKKKGQRTEHSQTYYYNHSHYNCLFLLLNTNNIEQIQKSDELFQLHQYVFEIKDFTQPYQLTQINIIKSIITHLIIKQFKLIRSLIGTNKQKNPNKYSNYQNYMITKLQYFERVYQGIQNLKKGFFLVRF